LWFAGKPEDMVKLMKRLGISLEEVNAVKVVIELSDGSRMILDPPDSVLLVKSKGQPPIFMVVGVHRVEKPGESRVLFTEDDVRLVAERAGVSLEEARRALEETGGDIAAAIIKLSGGTLRG